MSRAEDFSDNLLFKARPLDEGYNRIVARGEKGLKHLEFGILHLESGEWSGETGDCGQALDIHSGVIRLTTPEAAWKRLGERPSVFGGPSTAVYLPPHVSYTIGIVEGPVRIAIASAPAPGHDAEPTVIGPEDVAGTRVIANNVPAAKLIVSESVLSPGSWSSAHKHDALNPPREVPLEEVCHFRVSPPQGFGVIRIYTGPNDPGPMDEVYVIEDGDTVVIPRGYHIIGAAPGSTVHCTYALAGDFRIPGAIIPDAVHGSIES